MKKSILTIVLLSVTVSLVAACTQKPKANEVATLLKEKKKCDLVICISHLGWIEGGLGDQTIIAASRNIDLVLGGHTHTYFTQLEHVANLDGKLIPVDQNGKNGVWIGKIIVDLKKK